MLRRLVLAYWPLVASSACLDTASRFVDDRPESLTLEVQQRLGELDGPAALNDVLSAVAGPMGRVYVTQWQASYVRVYGRNGQVHSEIGSAGLGPGEFTMAGTVGFVADTLWVAGAPDRIGLFHTDGTFIRQATVRRPFGDSGASYSVVGYMAGPRLIAAVRVHPERLATGPPIRVPLLVVEFDGEIADTLAQVRLASNLTLLRFEGGRSYNTIPEFGTTFHAFSPDGSAVVVMEDVVQADGQGVLRATWINSSGDTIAIHEAPFSPAPFPETVRERVTIRLGEQLSPRWGTPKYVQELVEEQLRWPDRAPQFTSLVLGRDHRAWLKREDQGDSARWERWSPRSETVEETWLPSDLEIHYADSSQVWGERKDELGVPFLYRYEIVR